LSGFSLLDPSTLDFNPLTDPFRRFSQLKNPWHLPQPLGLPSEPPADLDFPNTQGVAQNQYAAVPGLSAASYSNQPLASLDVQEQSRMMGGGDTDDSVGDIEQSVSSGTLTARKRASSTEGSGERLKRVCTDEKHL